MAQHYTLLENLKDSPPASVWDEVAESYARLPAENQVFAMTHQLLYRIMEEQGVKPGQNLLDFNCGCGNDFPFFLERQLNITGCDGSLAMLQKAQELYSSGGIELYLGNAECLDEESFGGKRYDWIFSTTGGFSYVDDREMLRQQEVLYNMLKPGGHLLTAHLTPFCLPDTMYSLTRGRPKNAVRRWPGTIEVKIAGRPQKMYLRSKKHLQHVLGKEGRFFPVLAFTPPYQCGFRPSKQLCQRLYKMERKILRYSLPAAWADQVAILLKKQP